MTFVRSKGETALSGEVDLGAEYHERGRSFREREDINRVYPERVSRKERSE